VPLVSRALKVLSEREVSPQLGLLKTTLLQLDSTFSERTYGAGSFRDFAEKLQKAGVLVLSQGRGGWMIGPANGAPAETTPSAQRPDEGQPAHVPAAAAHGRPTAVIGTPADGVRALAQALGSIEIRRWPLYLRNVKQLLRQARPSFDERAYGFGSLVDLLRAAHKEGVFRVERDRQGVIRVFQGTAPSAHLPDTPAPVAIDEHPDVPDAGVAVVPADLDVPLVAEEPTADDAPSTVDEQAPATRSGRSRRRRATEARRTSRRKAVTPDKNS
jgi:hypothetical protein